MAETRSSLGELQESYENLITTLPPSNFDRSNRNMTIYQVLVCLADQRFLDLLERSPLLSALQGDGSEYTVFLPNESSITNQENTEESSDKTRQDFLSLHVSPHYTAIHETLLHMTNIPVCLQKDAANGPHVISTCFVDSKWKFGNNQVVVENICCSNGIIHKIASPFQPVLPYLMILQARKMMRFLEALRLSSVSFPTETRGCTIFAPQDPAFEALGEDINQFLFTTPSGLPYLQALIKAHLIPNLTMYSNFIWPKNNTGQRITSGHVWKDIQGIRIHELSSLLEDVSGTVISTTVTVTRCNRMIELSINGAAKVISPDIASCEGVVQVVDKVLLPKGTVENGYSLEQLKQILQPYVKI